jgi:hypothetical protein
MAIAGMLRRIFTDEIPAPEPVTSVLSQIGTIPSPRRCAAMTARVLSNPSKPRRTFSMSYSFSVRGTTKAETIEKLIAEFDKVVESKPIHLSDRAQAQAAAEAFLDIVPENVDGKDLYISVSGSVGWSGTLSIDVISASVIISASLVPAETN